MTEPTIGVPREARTLSGCDIGRIVVWFTTNGKHITMPGNPAITEIRHTRGIVSIRAEEGRSDYTMDVFPTDLVTVRGRTDA